ncbi:hypothetical protein Q8G42_00110 [Acinetobacter lwoffii]|uniref:Tetratricopeptide repeat protein n=1 Tax=Acinetobacter lwoffii TaxID=28090 RepID=A0AAW8AY81_ACILW|nr:hypothetical protein [Acinetobacter lwoffii]MDP1369193.1 hypothetical protein [Acinetobacter lwoffii]MDP1388647.1 hypothetical protein [Acinetobacter lwoffii]MDP1446363.1 hypothetical protein [Acinetobacter lwoffii]
MQMGTMSNQENIDFIVKGLKEEALSYYNNKCFLDALNCFKEVEEYKSLDNKDYYLKGLIHESLEQVDEAQNCFYVALRKVPKNKNYLNKFTEYMISHKLEDILLTKLERIIVLRSGTALEIQNYLIDFYLKNKEEDKALKVAMEAIFFNPNNSNILKKIIKIYDKKKAYKQGLLVANQLIELDQKDFEANMLLTNMQFRNNNKDSLPVENIYNFLPMNLDDPCESLSIVFSSIEKKFILKNYMFNTDRLFISENKMTFYTFCFNELKSYIANIIDNKKYKYINLIGSSKGSFAAINYGMALSKEFKDVMFQVVAFSPQTQLYPMNENIGRLPSYRGLNRLAKQNISIKNDLEKHGNLEQLNSEITDNINILAIYGELHERDEKECLRMKSFNCIELKPIESYPFHTSILLFTKKGEALIKGLTSRFDDNTVKNDDNFFAPQNSEELAKNFINSIDRYNYELSDYLI